LPSSNTTKQEFLEFIGNVGQGNTGKDPHPSPLPRRERGQETSQRILHTGHSQHFARRPQESCLYLNNNQTITCPDLATSNLTPYHLIVLSTCQTSIANHQTLNDEYIGLVSACLSGGASYTISSLWSIKDRASSPFFIHFYQQLAQHIPVPQALYHSSQWLRTITNQELSEFYQSLQQHPALDKAIRHKIDKIIAKLQQEVAATRPFQDPYYWAAFTVSGAVPELK
jgi:CHAT domain-containing protein